MVSAVWRPLLEKREKGRTHRSIRSTFSPRYTPPVDVAHPPWALNRVPLPTCIYSGLSEPSPPRHPISLPTPPDQSGFSTKPCVMPFASWDHPVISPLGSMLRGFVAWLSNVVKVPSVARTKP